MTCFEPNQISCHFSKSKTPIIKAYLNLYSSNFILPKLKGIIGVILFLRLVILTSRAIIISSNENIISCMFIFAVCCVKVKLLDSSSWLNSRYRLLLHMFIIM